MNAERKQTSDRNSELPRVGREVELLHALNAAAVSLQRSAQSEAEVFRAFREQIVGLGLRGSVSLLDEKNERLVIRAVAYPSQMLTSLEKLVGLKSEGLEFTVTKVDAYRQVLETGQAVFVADSSAVVSQLLPEVAQPFARRILKTLGAPPAIFAPLITEGRVRGILNIAGVGLTPDDVPAMEAFAHHISIALDNARLYAETHATRDYYNTLLNNLHDEILVINRDYIITDINEPLLRKTGYTREQVVGHHCYEIVHRLDSPCWNYADHPCPVMDIYRTGQPARATHIHHDAAGKAIYIHVAASPLSDETGQIVGVVESYRDVTTERHLGERLEAIYQLGQELPLLRDEAAILQRVLETAVETLQFEVAACGLVDEAAGVLEYRHLVGTTRNTLRLPLDGERGIGVAVVRSGQALNVPDTAQDLRYVPGDWVARSELCVPMKVGERVIGVLNAESLAPNHFTSDDQQVLQTLADQAAVALENARLYQAERARRQELEAVRRASLSLTASLELNQVLDAIVRAAFDLISASNADIFLYADGRLTFGADMRMDGPQNRPFAEPRPDGLTWTAVRRGEPIIVPDMRTHPLFANAPPDWEGAIVGLPLKIGRRVVGVMNVARPQPGPFLEAELRALRLLADQAAIAIENARLYQSERARYREAEALRQAALALTSTMSLPQLFERILAELQHVVPYDSASVQLLQEDKLKIIGGRGFPNLTELLGITFPARGDNPNASVLESREPVIIDDVRSHYPAFDVEPHVAADIHSWLGVPLLIGDRIIGMLALDKHEPDFYTEAHARAARAYASQAALAIENAQLHVETEQRAEHLAVLHELDQAITASLRITDVYHAFARHTARLLRYDRMSIALLEGDDVQVAFTAGEDDTRPPVGARLSLKTSAVGRVIAQGRPMLRHNLAADLPFEEDEQLAAAGIRSSMVIPLWVKGRVIGTWSIGSRQVGAYGPDDLEIAESMADQLAIAIENARLYEDLQARMIALQEVQARLVQSEKLAAIGELVAGVAHELNNPLTSIIGFAQLLQQSNVGGDIQRDLDKIVAQGRRVANIVRNLLDFARQRPPERKPIQINDVLNSTLDLLAYDLRTHNVKLTANLSPELPLTMADPHQMQQVFLNLLNNAYYSMIETRRGGHLTITTELATPTFINHQLETRPVIRIIIQDDGPGIPSDILPHIFDPFFTTKPPGEGTGLGLSVCHGIVSEHDGQIWAESEPDCRTTFFVELPIIAPQAQHRNSTLGQAAIPAAIDRPRILVIDDEVVILEMLDRVLSREGYHIDAANDGETALARIAETRYSLILCDVRMPGLDGQEIYRQVERQDPDLARRIIFITGDTVRPPTRRFFEETGLSYLGKPFEIADLIEKVHSITAGLE